MSSGNKGELPNPDTTVQELRTLNKYGPVRVVVSRADLSGMAGIEASLLTSPDLANGYARIGSSALRIRETRSSLSLAVQGREGDPVDLPLDRVRRVEVDHPYSSRMPLNGRVMGTITAYNCGPLRVPGWASYAFERGMYDVVESGIHPDNPGVGLVRTYDASRVPKPITVQAAKSVGAHCMTFLVSRVGREDISGQPYHIVTSCMGYDHEQVLTVVPPHEDPIGVSPKWVDMYDFPQGTTDNTLLLQHLERAGRYNAGSGLETLRQIAIDETILYIATPDSPVASSNN